MRNRPAPAAIALAALASTLMPPAPAADPPNPDYPRVNPAPWYEVDPAWPREPDALPRGMTPGVAVDDRDRVWVFSRAAPPVRLYSPDGALLKTWGDGVVGVNEKGVGAHYLRIDREGMLWLADIVNHVILRATPEGKVLRTLGTPGRPGCDETHLFRPTDMAVAPDGHVFVSDGYGNARVVHFDADGKFVKAWGKLGTAPGEFSIPHSIVIDSKGRLYVADRNNARIQVFDREGALLDVWRDIMVPWGLWISASDEIWACGCTPMQWRDTDKVLSCPPKDQIFVRFDVAGRVRQIWAVPKCEDGQEQPGQLNWLHGVALDSRGNLYATDINGRRVQRFLRRQ